MTQRHTLTVFDGEKPISLQVGSGSNLRQVLLENGLSPYASLTARLNCGGRGLCATCGVRVVETVAPTHWHDRAAERFGYPRLSCQITIDRDLTVHLIPEKRIWGSRQTGWPDKLRQSI